MSGSIGASSSLEHDKLTGPVVAVLLVIHSGKQPRGAGFLAARKAEQLGLVASIPRGWALTRSGDLVVQAYAIGRRRWGAG